MRIAMIGLGKMGANMTERLVKGGHEVVVFDLSADALKQAAGHGAETATTLEEVASKLTPPRAAWVMLPAGAPTNDTIDKLAGLFAAGDVIVDGGNSNYKEAEVIAARLQQSGVGFVDAGTSGGVWGLTEGYCLMVGGTKEAVAVVEPALLTLAPEGGYAHVGPSGAGHYVKMVHNGIEYGMMQAYGEGFEVMSAADEFNLDLHQIASIWRYGSVVRSWLLDLAERGAAARCRLRRDRARRGRLGGGPLDRSRGDRPRGARSRDRHVALHSLRVAGQRLVPAQAGGRVAQPIRRARRHPPIRPAGPGDRDPEALSAC